MEWLDRFQGRLGNWYQTHFGVSEESELTPKDVLRKIIDAMEEFRSEGLDGRIYVPNRYVLELAAMNAEERAYMLSFLDEEDLTIALERYMAHKNYFTRGPLDFTIEELDAIAGEEKLYIRALFDKSVPGRSAGAAPAAAQPERRPSAPVDSLDKVSAPDSYDRIADELTVERRPRAGYDDEPATVHAPPTAWAALLVQEPDGRRSVISINKPVFTIGRSRHSGNDLVLGGDGQVSKRHVRIELESDGGATLYDLASTNGTCVNGKLVPVNTALHRGDIIEIGQTRIEFQRESERPTAAVAQPPAPPAAQPPAAPAPAAQPPTPQQPERKPRLTRISDGSEHMLGSETLIGRSMTSDLVLGEPSVSTQQARIMAGEDGRYTIQDLSGRGTTIVNGRPARMGERVHLNPGDRVNVGGVAFTFQA